jgi:hypothetical protein
MLLPNSIESPVSELHLNIEEEDKEGPLLLIRNENLFAPPSTVDSEKPIHGSNSLLCIFS